MGDHLPEQLANFNKEAKEELRIILNDPEKFEEIQNSIKNNPITLEDHNNGIISLMSIDDLDRLKKQLNLEI